jgi:hypothetical protein
MPETKIFAATRGEDKIEARRTTEQLKDYTDDLYYVYNFGAQDIRPNTTSGCAWGNVTSQRGVNLTFSGTVAGYAHAQWVRPKLLRRASFIAETWFYQSVADSGDVLYRVQLQGWSEDTDPITGISGFGPSPIAETMLNNVDKVGKITSATSGVVDLSDDECYNIRLFRNATTGADTSTQEFKVLAVRLTFHPRYE